MKKKTVQKILQIILHLAGFPLLITMVVLQSLHIIETGLSYGVMVFLGIIITVVMAIIYYLVFFLMAKKNKKTIYQQTMISIIVAVVCLGGIWIASDIFMPAVLEDATSGTIFYEDLIDDYDSRADVNKELLDEYINRNFKNGNLSNKTLEQYLEEGARNKEVMGLLKQHFQSIDKDGYATFVGPWMDMADDERLTIPTLVHLIVNKRQTEDIAFPLWDEEQEEMIDDPVLWSVLDMLGEPMEFGLGPDDMDVIPPDMIDMLNNPLTRGVINATLEKVTDAIEDEAVVGSPIYLRLEDGAVLTLTPSNESRGVLDYKSMAWLDSNNLIFAITSVLAIRKMFLIFAGVLVITSFAIGLLRDDGKNNNQKAAVKSQPKKQESESKPKEKNFTVDSCQPEAPNYVMLTPSGMNLQNVDSQLAYETQYKVIKKFQNKD